MHLIGVSEVVATNWKKLINKLKQSEAGEDVADREVARLLHTKPQKSRYLMTRTI